MAHVDGNPQRSNVAHPNYDIVPVSFGLSVRFRTALVLTPYPGSLYRSTASIIFNQKVWDAMPEPDRAAIEKVSGEALAALAGGNLDDATEQARAELEPAGIEVIEAGADQITQLRQSEEVEAAIAKWKEKVAGLGLDPDEVISFYRAQLEELDN
ncbi:MAG: hypothetical protein ABGX47_19505 [Martelella sp.]|uniref:hypothetical protein n=1 Tax=Martelella sp. TaxID=1969699 RepID=UPI003241C761